MKSTLPVIAHLEKNNYNVTYMADWEQSKPLLSKLYDHGIHTVIASGHSEYHTDYSRKAIEVIEDKPGMKWLSLGANLYFEQMLKGKDCGEEYEQYDDDLIFCRSQNGQRTWYARDLGDPETKYLGVRYVDGGSGSPESLHFGPTEVLMGSTYLFHLETGTSLKDFPIKVENFSDIETDTRSNDVLFGNTIPFKNSIVDFIIMGSGTFPSKDGLEVQPTYIRLKNCSQLLHLASLGAGYGLIPKELNGEFAIDMDKKGAPNEQYAGLINTFISSDDNSDGYADLDVNRDGIFDCLQ